MKVKKSILNHLFNKQKTLLYAFALLSSSLTIAQTTIPDPNQGLRADWLRGAVGMLWLPESNYNGNIEGIRIDPFLEQIDHLKTVDFIQVGLASPNIYSPVHTAPHPLLEMLWNKDRDENGKPINLIVPREAVDDPFLSWLLAIKAKGLKTQVYVNSYNMLTRSAAPGVFPDISNRWMEYCDTSTIAQDFINSQPYYAAIEGHDERRPYMFCYAEFILKVFAKRYGHLIDSWLFDSADNIMEACGDNPSSELVDEQRIYQAFADACHAGNPDAAIAFNNSVGTAARPFATPTLFDDYTFGHPFGGAGDMVETESLYNRNFGICEYMQEHNGLPFATRDTRDWNDNVVGHYFPKQSTTSWNAGANPVLTDSQFVVWNQVGLINGGAIAWGTPMRIVNLINSGAQENLILQSYALHQFELLDTVLCETQYPGAPNWARQATIFPNAIIGEAYTHTLEEGVDFWDPEGDEILDLLAIDAPAWLTIEETEPGTWTLSGTPTEITPVDYEFSLSAADGSNSRTRMVSLSVIEEEIQTIFTSAVQIQATANTNYGIDKNAIMFSEIQTAPDSLATYQISITLTPAAGKAIVSGESGGSSTIKSFGVGTTNADDLFTGSDEDWIDNIGDIKIVNFNANGGSLTEDNIVKAYFSSIRIVNAQSTNDNVHIDLDDFVFKYGKTPENPYDLDLVGLSGGVEVSEFAIGTGNTSTTNKWSIDGITVEVVFEKQEIITSIIEKEEAYFDMFPNPVSDVLSFNTKPKTVEFYDVSGKLVKQHTSGNISVNISELQNGIYTVKFFGEEGNVLYKRLLKTN